MTIYKVTNLVNGKIYIGKTVQPFHIRKKSHLNAAVFQRDNFIFHRALKKHGAENFRWEIIDRSLFEKDILALEKQYIAKFNSVIPNGYNMTIGGEGVPGCHPSVESRKKLSLAVSGSKNHNFGKTHTVSAETREKLRQANLGKKASIETRKKLSLAHVGKKHTAEQTAKFSSRMKGHPVSDETKKKLSESNRGQKRSFETKQNLRLAWVRRRALLEQNKSDLKSA